MRNEKYGVSTYNVFLELVAKIQAPNYNPVTVSTIKDILKNRAKRGDLEALSYYSQYFSLRSGLHSLVVYEILISYFKELDLVKRAEQTLFEDLENKYFYKWSKIDE